MLDSRAFAGPGRPPASDHHRQRAIDLYDGVALEQHGVRVAERRAAVLRTGGALTGIYGADYLSELRQDWPA